MNVKKIVKAWLIENGYDGLYGGECECSLDDLMPCFDDCEAGYKKDCDCGDPDHDFHIGQRNNR